MTVLVLVEHDHHKIKPATFATINAAKAFSQPIELLVVGANCQNIAAEGAKLADVQKVKIADHAAYQHQLAENTAKLIVELTKEYDYVLAPATTWGKNLLPRVAALCDVALISDVMQILSPDTFLRPMYAGNIIAKVQLLDKLKMLTIRTTAFSKSIGNQSAVPIEAINTIIENDKCHFVNEKLTESKRPELTSARVVIAGGRGLKSAENFKILESIADLLGAAIGASRAAVDAGFAPNDYQVGQTGKVVAPDLYIAVGISGAIQHLAGMKDSKVIVAINNDPDAPIFEVSDYVLVGDLFKVLPELEKVLAASH